MGCVPAAADSNHSREKERPARRISHCWRDKKCGNTPATIIKKFHFASITNRGEKLQKVPPYLEIAETQTEYQMLPESSEPALSKISDAEMQGINSGNKELYILGQMLYRDAFGKIHETRYCMR